MSIGSAILNGRMPWLAAMILILVGLAPLDAKAARAAPGSEILSQSGYFPVYDFHCDQRWGTNYMLSSFILQFPNDQRGANASVSCAQLYHNSGQPVALGAVQFKSFAYELAFRCDPGSVMVGVSGRFKEFSCRKMIATQATSQGAASTVEVRHYQGEQRKAPTQLISTCNDGYAVGGIMSNMGQLKLDCESRPGANIGGTLLGADKESDNTNINCHSALSSSSIKLRIHEHDENAPTRYLCSRWYQNGKMLTLTGSAEQEGPRSEKDSNFNCAANRVMISRRHTGDEKGNTTITCQGYQEPNFQQPITVTNPYSIEQKESASWIDCGQGVFTGRKHDGDETGQTTVTCRELY